MAYFLNPKRRNRKTWRAHLKYYLTLPIVRFLLWLGFPNRDYSYHDGYPGRLKIGEGCSTMNTYFNTNSGTITLGDDTIFGDDCLIITGQHRFYKGKRARLVPGAPKEVPDEGNDIVIGSGCFICSGSIIIKKVTIGDNVLLGAGSVVTKDIPSNCFACGVPAQVKHFFNTADEKSELVNSLNAEQRI